MDRVTYGDDDNVSAIPLGVGDTVSASNAREKARIEPIDSRIRLHFKNTQGVSIRSRANFGNTHIMASQPHPANASVTRFVEEGLSFVEARKKVVRATREAHQRFVREGEQELAKEMSLKNVLEKARNAHTLGTVTLTNKIERMHKRVREQRAREMLEYNEQFARKESKKKCRISPANAHDDSGRDGLPPQLSSSIIRRPLESLVESALLLTEGEINNPMKTRKTDVDKKTERYSSIRECTIGSGYIGEMHGGDQREVSSLSREVEALGGTLKQKASQLTPDVCFLLRNIYTGGGLDAQQQEWKSLPMELFNTLTLQLGTISKINIPRNNLERLISFRTPSFSCEHMRSVTEVNLSGNKLREFPDEAQRLTSLRTLRLDNNNLCGLPEGLLSLRSLTSLSLRHNNFSELPYRFGDLLSLERLDLGENMLKSLPATMGLLTALKHLKLDGNNMSHLAVPPLLKTSDAKDPSIHWAKRWNTKKKKKIWMNDITGETSEADPTSASTYRSSSTTISIDSTLESGTLEYCMRRNYLANRGVYEWETAFDISAGKVYYTNNVNFRTVRNALSCCCRPGGKDADQTSPKVSALVLPPLLWQHPPN